MRRILYLSDENEMGGSERQLLLLLTNLDRHRYHPVVVCRREGAYREQLRRAGIETYVLPLPLRPWWSPGGGLPPALELSRLTHLACELNASLIHANKLELGPYLAGAAQGAGVPSVLHVRSPLLTATGNPLFLTGSLELLLRRALLSVRLRRNRCPHADMTIAISTRVRRNLLLGGIQAAKIALIDDAVDTAVFHPRNSLANTLRAEYPHAEGIFIGMAGRIGPFKRQLHFLQAAAQIIRAHRRRVTFFLIGRPESARYSRQVSEFIRVHGLEGHVILTGGRSDMPQVLGSLDILVSLSGGSIMFEGMASGKPVVSAGFSTPRSSVHLQDGRTGLLVPSSRSERLVPALLRLIDDAGLRSRLGLQARVWAERALGHSRMVSRIQDVYENLLASHAGRRLA